MIHLEDLGFREMAVSQHTDQSYRGYESEKNAVVQISLLPRVIFLVDILQFAKIY